VEVKFDAVRQRFNKTSLHLAQQWAQKCVHGVQHAGVTTERYEPPWAIIVLWKAQAQA
jgi:hypothetical protein